jgi:dipeptidyl aminopeptidase/acylaminoacyl peptidase
VVLRAWTILIVGLVLVVGAPAGAAPLSAYGRLPSLDMVRISPDGAMLASIVTDGEKRHVVIRAVGSRQTALDLNFGAAKVRGLQWAGTEHVIASFSTTGNLVGLNSHLHEFMRAIDIDWKNGSYRALLSGVPYALNVIYGLPEIRFLGGRPFAFVKGTTILRYGSAISVFRVDMQAGASMRQTVGYPDTTDFVVDGQGRTIAQERFDARSSRWSLEVWKGQWTPVADLVAPVGAPQVVGLGRDGVSIAVAVGGDEQGFVTELKPDGSAWGDKIPVPDADGLIWDGATHTLIGEGHLEGDDIRYEFYDPADQLAWKRVAAAFAGALVRLESFTDDHRRFVVHVDAPATPPAFYLVDLAGGAPSLIGDEYPALAAGPVARVEPVAFKAADGTPLGGYLTLPGVRPPPRGLPLVVLVHGGPAARDAPGFDWWPQALASRGYAVLQVNYRGSAGLGTRLFTAGFGEWGRRMQTDLSDGVRAMVARGLVDPARVCIVGASYGGYAALAGATLDTGVYRCAASVAGPSDLGFMLAEIRKVEGARGEPVRRYWFRYMGEHDLEKISPARLAARVTIPILLIHGKDDTIVPYEPSQIMADALRKAGKDVEFVTLDGEDHWLSQGATRLLMLQAMVDFLRKNDPPDMVPTS